MQPSEIDPFVIYDRQPTHSKAVDVGMKIFQQHDPYCFMTPDEMHARWVVPTMWGNSAVAAHVPSKTMIAFTYMWPETTAAKMCLALGQTPAMTFWRERGDELWIGDFASTKAPPGVSATRHGLFVGRMLVRTLLAEQIGTPGDHCFFRRNGGSMPGRLTAVTLREQL